MEAVAVLQNKMQNMAKENPFYGKKALLSLMQQSTKSVSTQLLDNAWSECRDDKTLREAFFVIVFSIGDITNRQHNVFGKANVDNGGNSLREQFMFCMKWALNRCPEQYYAFLQADLLRQYSCLFSILGTQVQTKKGTTTIKQVINMLEGVDLDKMADYLAKLIKTSHPGEKNLIAKWLVRPRTSARQAFDKKTGERKGKRPLQKATRDLMEIRSELYLKLSQRMGWVVEEHKNNYLFRGLNDWKKEWNGKLESVLFSSKKILEFDQQQFAGWLDTLPAGARYRVKRRLLDGDGNSKKKWITPIGDLADWFLQWEQSKEVAQQEQRELEEKVRQGDDSEETKQKLQKVKKEAKVTTGADTVFSLFEKVTTKSHMSQAEFDTSMQSIIDKVKFEVPVLTIADCSGSMGGLPTLMARLTTTLCMLKNPSPDLDNVLVRFGTRAEFVTDGSKGHLAENRFMQGQMKKVNRIIDREAPFSTNFNSVTTLIDSRMGGTRFDSVSVAFKQWLDSASDEESKQVRREMIQQYPVFLVISDGDLNNQGTPAQSMKEFQQNMLQWFGWNGVVVVWNVQTSPMYGNDKFEGLENVIHYYGYNAGIVNTIFTKIHDLDIIDIFTPLKSLYESSRYQPVKEATL